MMLRSGVIAETGSFDESFFMYAEDVDLCQRIRSGGHQVLYTPRAEIVHLLGKSADSNRGRVALEYRRSQLYFYLKHYGRRKLLLLKLYLLLKSAVNFPFGDPAQRSFHRRLFKLILDF